MYGVVTATLLNVVKVLQIQLTYRNAPLIMSFLLCWMLFISMQCMVKMLTHFCVNLWDVKNRKRLR